MTSIVLTNKKWNASSVPRSDSFSLQVFAERFQKVAVTPDLIHHLLPFQLIHQAVAEDVQRVGNRERGSRDVTVPFAAPLQPIGDLKR